jgi:ATP-dependent DNA helicase RecG
MTQTDLLEIIRNGESSRVEFKTEDVHPHSLAEEILAFANFEGGLILIGVSDTGEIPGCTRPDIEEFVINVCRNNIRPSIIPDIETKYIDEKMALAVTIPRSDTAHATSNGRYFIRVGSTKQSPTQQELIRLFQKRKLLQYDETPVLQAGPQSIDKARVNTYLERLEQAPLDDSSDSETQNELVNISILLEVDQARYPTLGGLMMFGSNPQKFFPSFTILLGAYKGTDQSATVISEKETGGTLDRQIDDVMSFFRFVIPQNHSLENDTQRSDAFLYPLPALREAVVNAVCHRDYTIIGSAIRVFVFSDRVEIHSPGGLPNTLTLQSIRYRQFTRNQTIASFLTGMGYMERRGTGVIRMQKLSEEAGCRCDFSLAPDGSEFIVAFSNKKD